MEAMELIETVKRKRARGKQKIMDGVPRVTGENFRPTELFQLARE